MKKALKTILGLICIIGIILAGGEEADGSCNIIWTLSWLAVALVAGMGLNKLIEETK